MVSIALNLARRFAPHLVRRLAGDKAGDVAERVLGIASDLTGASDPEEIQQRLDADPELAHAFRMKAAELDAEISVALLEDRQDARERQLRMAELGKSDRLMVIVGVIVVLGFVATVLSAFIFGDQMSDSQVNLVFALAGTLGAMSSQVVSYFYGSSRGSLEKTRMMEPPRGQSIR